MQGDGDGWVFDGQARYWGRYGAAGLLLCAQTDAGTAVLLQHRAWWSHQGDTWGIPGGARDSHESAQDTAVREAHEETGIVADGVRIRDSVVTHSTPIGWEYTTVIADVAEPLATQPNDESTELRWVAAVDVAALHLHPGFATAWPMLMTRIG